jgi:integrase
VAITRKENSRGVRYQAAYRAADGGERTKTFARKTDADRWEREQRSARDRGLWVDPRLAGRLTVGTFGEQWLATRVNLKPGALEGYKSLWRSRVRPRWGDTPLGRVAHSDIVEWVADLNADGLSASRVRQAHQLLSAMLEAALKDQKLGTNPAKGIELPRLPRRERRYLDHGQLGDLARACGDYELLVLLLGYCGLRWGEAAALRVRRVDTRSRRLHVAESFDEKHGKFGLPKDHQRRLVPVPAFLWERLEAHIAGRDPEDFVFSAPEGGVLRNGNFRTRCFNPATKRVGLSGFVPHELRHTAASIAISSGASIKAVQRMLGHASAVMTLDRYGHLYPDDLDELADRIDAAARKAADFARTSDDAG